MMKYFTNTYYRIYFFLFSLLLAVTVGCQQQKTQVPSSRIATYYMGQLEWEKAKGALKKKNPNALEKLKELKQEVDELLGKGPYSVVYKTGMPPSKDKHDYMTIAPYFWENPDTEDGLPYIRKDGEVNPQARNEFTDYVQKDACFNAVSILGKAFYFSEEKKYAEKAVELIRAWFIEPATKMNPNLNFGQGIPGLNDGRPFGIIEFTGIRGLIRTAELIKEGGALDVDTESQFKQWLEEYANWLQESELGKQESTRTNNHGTWFDVQLCTILIYLGEEEKAKSILEAAKENRIAEQIEPDGSQPKELARTKSFSYSAMNLNALTNLAFLGRAMGVDLWGYESADGRSIKKGYEYLIPYLQPDTEWPYQQLGDFEHYKKRFKKQLLEAGREFGDEDLRMMANENY